MKKAILEIGNLSDIGRKRTANEDYYGLFSGNFGTLIVVCDGMGGHKGGAFASRLAVETIKFHFERLPDEFNPTEELRNALIKANKNILEKASESEELKEMGSTAVVLLIKGHNAYYAHIGDSRIYLIREGKIHQLTKDHSLVQQLVDSGIINQENAKNHPQKNVITRSLGSSDKNQPEIAEPITIFKNDIFILCTDGLTGYLSDNELLEIATTNDCQTSCLKMVDLANERGGSDNITVQVIKVAKGKRLPLKIKEKFKKNKLPLIIGLSSIFLLLVLFFVFFIPGQPEKQQLSTETQGKSQMKKSIIEVDTSLKTDKTISKEESTKTSSSEVVRDTSIEQKKDTNKIKPKKNKNKNKK